MPYPQNFPSISDLVSWPVGDIAALPADALAAFQNEADELLQAAKAGKARIDDALTLKYADASAASRRVAGKDTGTVRVQDGPVTIIADLSKRVDWDQAALAGLVEKIKADGEDPTEYLDIAFKVSERKYNAWPSHIQAAFREARTVQVGKESFTLVLGEGAQ